jgi:Tol biopolymer transport system component
VPVWSPDDKRIAFCSTRTGKYEIWVINADGSGLQQLTHAPGAQLISPVWSPDGARLACGRIGGDALIIEAGNRLTAQRLESLPPLGRQDVNFGPRSWSPDGKKLAGDLRHRNGTSSGLVVYSVVDKKYDQLTTFGCFPKWLGDGRRLVFYDESKIYLADTRSRRLREIHSAAPHIIEHGPHLGISRDNRWIYFSLAINEADIWLMSVESAKPDFHNR